MRSYTGALACAAFLLFSRQAAADVFEIDANGTPVITAHDHRAPVVTATSDSANMRAQTFRPLINRVAIENAISPALLESLVRQESGFHADAVSSKGAIGLAQLMPDTARELGVNPYDPEANLQGGARYLRQQLVRFGDLESALAAYNAGPNRVLAAGGIPPIEETRNFVASVIGRTGYLVP